MSCGSIYKIQFPNGKHYIGLTTTSLEQRTKEHRSCAKSGDNKCLYNAIRKYDMIDNIKLIEIDTADTNEELCEKEKRYIHEYNSYYMNGRGYNMTYGGEGTNGYVFTEEDKLKMSESAKNYFDNRNEDEIQKFKEAHSKPYEGDDGQEKRQKISETKKQYYLDHPEAIQLISETQKKRYEDPEEIKKNSERMIKYNKEHPEKGKEHSERMFMRFQNNPILGKEQSNRLKILFQNPDAIQKNKDSQLKYNKEHPEKGEATSKALKERWGSTDFMRKIADGKGRNKPFDLFKTDGTFIKTFTYQFEAKEYLKKEHSITSAIAIGGVLSGKKNSSKGFVFKYK
jgi:hypothetical protein